MKGWQSPIHPSLTLPKFLKLYLPTLAGIKRNIYPWLEESGHTVLFERNLVSWLFHSKWTINNLTILPHNCKSLQSHKAFGSIFGLLPIWGWHSVKFNKNLCFHMVRNYFFHFLFDSIWVSRFIISLWVFRRSPRKL